MSVWIVEGIIRSVEVVYVHCRYMYCGEIVLCVDNVLGLFVLADKYNVIDLKCMYIVGICTVDR